MTALDVRIFPDRRSMGVAEAAYAADILRAAIAERGRARIVIGTGPSQDEMIRALMEAPGIAWARVAVFHMDEYAGIPSTHPASFRLWLKTHVADVVHPGEVHYLDGDAPESRPVQGPELGQVVELPEVGGLHHRYVREAA